MGPIVVVTTTVFCTNSFAQVCVYQGTAEDGLSVSVASTQAADDLEQHRTMQSRSGRGDQCTTSDAIGELETAQSLLALASRGDRMGEACSWEQCALEHPQRALPVTVCEGRAGWLLRPGEAGAERALSRKQRRQAKKSALSALPDAGGGVGGDASARLSVVSWNILSDTWLRSGNYRAECGRGTPLEWDERRALILQWIDGLAPSVLALQEVDFARFGGDLLPALQERGYEGVSQTPKKIASSQPCGCATFWQRDRFQLVAECTKSRALAVHLRAAGTCGGEFVLVNVHLQAQPLDPATAQAAAGNRARQLHSPLEWAAREARGVPVVVAGDFNAGLDSPLLHVLRSQTWHGHALASAYEHPAAAPTIPASVATFAGHGGRHVLDHIFYAHEHLRLVHLLQPLCAAEARRSFCSDAARSLPDKICPSDHIPIAAVLSFVRNSSADGVQAPACRGHVPEPCAAGG